MQELIILGTGIHAEEMAEIVERVNLVTPTWKLLGYLQYQSEESRVGESLNGVPVVGTQSDVQRYEAAALVADNGGSARFGVSADRLVTLIDPACFVSRSAVLGPGCVLYPGCFVGAHARLGRDVFCLAQAVVNHDCTVGERTVMATGARLAGGCTVEPDCYLGQGCTVREYTRIGRHALVGTGAVVVADVPADKVVVGNPARVLRTNTR